MAKKTKKTSVTATLTAKDKKTLGSIRDLAGGVIQFAERGRPPYVDVPSRSLSNVRFNQSRRIIEMGSGSNRRELFNLAQARS
jgi:DNA topoisomerase-6 subunit A